ncbi:hypothetical protein F2Q69_00049260 [Brassica cretica]|uniref:Uncharacterized protein n=1 Tax=Brassica cretica TaxID=69181 RepID=A0A8S9PUC2_BRACR|nr:hypothetical protein F2Q69_00049260 [Brassica cretica]
MQDSVTQGFILAGHTNHYRPSLLDRSIVKVDRELLFELHTSHLILLRHQHFCHQRVYKQGSSSKLHWIELIFPFVDIMEGIKKKELVSIGEQNTFVSNSTEQCHVCSLRHVDDKARQKRYTYTGSSGELADKDFVFHIRVTPYNFTLNHSAFTVSAISDDSFFRTQAESSSSNQVQSWVWEVGEAPACASNTVDAAKLPVGVDEGNPPGSVLIIKQR